MKLNHTYSGNKKRTKVLSFLLSLFVFLAISSVSAQTKPQLRRPISPQQPMWLIHIDTWNYADPQKIIDLIPKDIRPYVVMNISLSINHDVATSRFKIVEYGYETAKSWLRTCAENKMWATIQIASGGYTRFSDFDLSVYEEFYRDYPNLIGFSYAEQFWGFDDASDPISPKWSDRMAHFADLLKVSNKYGGYLIVSWCGNQWGPSINPIGMMKRNPSFAAACRDYTENYILCEKYTQQSYISDVESICLGSYLSGYSGQYGIRYDDTGWTDATGTNANYTLATAGAPHLEHIMLTGETVIDGPEIIWTQCFKENNAGTTSDGYTRRSWSTYAHFDNVMVDVFRKILDGTVRIPTRKEVIDRTKVVVVADVNSTDVNATYSSPQTLFEGLYRMDGDGNYENNKTLFKKTGRYPTIPTVYSLDDTDANSFQIKINKSAYSTRWPSLSSKVDELNTLFPQEYTGDLYAGRNENGWVVYNPFKSGQRATANIPFKYNTCDHMYLSFAQYTSGVVKEYPNKATFYLCNYDDQLNTALKADTIKIYGSSVEPTWSYTERGSHQVSIITKNWSGGVFTLAINHNGALDVSVDCAGIGTGRLTSYTPSALITPKEPDFYTGPRQYEAEFFDRKNISSLVASAYNGNIRNYTGQGYLVFGTNSSASVRDTVTALKSGMYKLKTKYSASGGNVSINLNVNGVNSTILFKQTVSDSDWVVDEQSIKLNSGSNVITFSSVGSSNNINFDNIIIERNDNGIYNFSNDVATNAATSPAAELITTKSGTAGVVSYTDASSKTSNCFKAYSCAVTNSSGVADLNMFPLTANNYTVVWKEYYGTVGAKKGVLIRGSESSSYAVGLKQGYLFAVENNQDNTVTLRPYVAGASSLTAKSTYTTSFKIMAGQACWYRATALDNTLKFECSSDSVNWVGGTTTAFTDNTYATGSTQLVWGLESNILGWVMDNITCFSTDVSTSKLALSGFAYPKGSGPSSSQSFFVTATSLSDDLVITAPSNFEVSKSAGTGYVSRLTLTKTSDSMPPTQIYVRLKSGLDVGTYGGEMFLTLGSTRSSTVSLNGSVVPQSVSHNYDFSTDVAGTSATTPPAINTIVSSGNTATAGVVSYKDINNKTSNVLMPYSGGQRNVTGVVNLNLFSRKSTDYSVTWKQYVGAISKDYKVGVLLRGDTANIGDASNGYVQGLMNGYLFIAYTTTGHTEFRIYKSTASTSLSMLVNTSIAALIPSAGQPVWYRATVLGSSSVSMKFEYSTDSITWNVGSTTTDSTLPFISGATQVVWGLGVGNVDFYMDNITFNGIESILGTPTAIVQPVNSDLTIISKEYYTFSGVRILNSGNKLKGLYILRCRMSDGSVISSKILFM